MTTLAETKESPILFSGPMVQAILDGRKTQTRRVVKSCVPAWVETFGYSVFTPDRQISGRGNHPDYGPSEVFLECPYGKPGDRLLARQAWSPTRPMPNSAFRATLEITGIRVERVQDLSHRDAVAEGWNGDEEKRAYIEAIGDGDDACIEWYADLWDSIYFERGFGWDLNPWVWVISFKRLTEANVC